MPDLIVYEFERQAVERNDYSDFLRRFVPTNLPAGKELANLVGSLILIVSGYEEDTREVYAIPAVRAFCSICP